MRQVFAATALAGVLSLAAGGALPQPMTGPGGFMHGQRPGRMGQGLGFTDPSGYLNNLKVALGITAAQEPAWNEYADTVKGAAGQMQGAHQTMFDAMGTATWQERRDMMNRMFEVRQASFDQVHAAADKLLPALDASQRTKAETRLPGLAAPGYGMMGRMGPGPRAP
jgi:hypothetical protein